MAWETRFAEFFQGPSLVDALTGTVKGDGILDAEGCRELWLQGEAFRFFRAKGHGFICNGFPLRASWVTAPEEVLPSGKIDFGCLSPGDSLFDARGYRRVDAKPTMLAELKVLGNDYQSHVLCGSLSRGELEVNGAPYHTNLRRIPGADWHSGYFNTLEGAYRRLVAYKAEFDRAHPAQDRLEAWLLLVVDQRKGNSTELSKQLASVEFPEEERFELLPSDARRIRVTGWRIKN